MEGRAREWVGEGATGNGERGVKAEGRRKNRNAGGKEEEGVQK